MTFAESETDRSEHNSMSPGKLTSGFGSKNNSTKSCTSTSHIEVDTSVNVNWTPTEESSILRLSLSFGPGI